MTTAESELGRSGKRTSSGWNELWLKEDWWAIWLGLSIVVVGLALFETGGSWRWVAVTPAKWTSVAQLATHFADNWLRYFVQFALWAAAFGIALSAMGRKLGEFIPAFTVVYLLSVVVFVI